MRLILGVRRVLSNLLHRQRIEAELDAEVRAYAEMIADEKAMSGDSGVEARRTALAEIGGIETVKQAVREHRAGTGLETLLQDVRYALRQLLRSPGFSFTALLTLTMAIGANVIVFGVVHALLLNPLAVPQPKDVYSLQGRNADSFSFSFPEFEQMRERSQAFSGIALVRLARVGLDSGSQAVPVWGYEVSSNYFAALGVQPVLGRFFAPFKDTNSKINSDPSAVLSYDCWTTEFGRDLSVVGKTVRISKLPFVVIGVAPRGFYGTERLIWPKIWLPIADEPEIEGYNWIQDRGTRNGWLVGRVKPAVSRAQANADLSRVAARIRQQDPDYEKDLELRVARPGLFGDAIAGPAQAFLTGVMLMALLVLLAACANLAGFFTARMTDRARELAIRIAVGASRTRLLRQLLTESILIALLGGIAASVAAMLALRTLSAWHPSTDFPFEFVLNPGAIVYLFSFALALFTGLLFGLLPARQIWRTDPNRTFKSATATASGRRFSLRDILLAVQIALCCLLVTSSLVALGGLLRTLKLNLGIDPKNVTLAETDLQLAGYAAGNTAAIQQRMLDAVRQIPGVESASVSNTTPLSANQSSTSIFAPGTTNFRLASAKLHAEYYEVAPGYFPTAGTRLLRGRDFTADDNANAPRVAIVNQTFAQQLFATADAVGKTFPSGDGNLTRVVGVVENGKYVTFAEEPRPAIFWPLAQRPDTSTVLLVRSGRPPTDMIPEVRRAIATVDPTAPLLTLDAWPNALSVQMLPARAATVAFGVLGVFAVLLAITGIFGLASYTVSRRNREFGVRMALGAQHGDILRAALGRVCVLLVTGSVAGAVLSLAGSRVIASIVSQASAFDPLALAATALIMALIGFLAAFWPARVALAIKPAVLLRGE
jgi:predicted permease